MRKKVKDWRNKSLTYAGRLQLIVAVLESIQAYWASVFLLPKTIITEINRLLKWFLWNKGEAISRKAKVAWKAVCKSRDQGGLGLKDIAIWNEALIFQAYLEHSY